MATDCPAIDAALVARDILLLLPGATQALLEIELQNAVRDFCEQSLAIRADSSDILPAGTNEITLADTTDGMQVIKVLYLRGPSGPLYPSPASRQYAVNSSGAAFRFYCPERNKLVFDSLVTEATPLDAVVALKPGLSCTKLPVAAYDQHYEAIKAGAMGRMHGHIGKAYSNLVMSSRLLARAKSLAVQARFQADQENTMGDPGWRFPKYGG